MPLIFENYNTQTLPCTASQSNALASLCKLCNIILNCAWGPWLVQTPCSLTQSLCASSGASQLTLIASQYRATSPGVCRILWFFPVAMIGSQCPLINGKTIILFQIPIIYNYVLKGTICKICWICSHLSSCMDEICYLFKICKICKRYNVLTFPTACKRRLPLWILFLK